MNKLSARVLNLRVRFRDFRPAVSRLKGPEKALAWVRGNHLQTGGIRVESGHANSYPEVTGYFIPTLLNFGEKNLSVRLTEWLICSQRTSGAFTDPDEGREFVFDTGQVLRGLLAARELVPRANVAARRAMEYLHTQMIAEGAGGFPKFYSNTNCPESVLLYVLPPLLEAGNLFEVREICNAVERCASYYVASSDFLRLNDLTHFLGYEIEALIDLGRGDLARSILDQLCAAQKPDGSIRGAGGASWVCSPGLAQLAICWYKLGQWEAADKAMSWLEAKQELSGGFRGSYGPGAAYKPNAEVAWAPKFYLDAHLLRVAAFFDRHCSVFPEVIDPRDGRVQAVLAKLKEGDKVLEVGCGKGRFLRVIKDLLPQIDCTGVDPSCALLRELPPSIQKYNGSLENIPLADNTFDVVFSVEAVEHSPNLQRAIAEMVRVGKPGGWIIVVDKHRGQWGRLQCPPWERWPDVDELKGLLREKCDDVTAESVGYDGRPASDGLMIAWRGRKRSRLRGAEWNSALISQGTERQIVDAVRFNRLSDWGRILLLETEHGQHVLEIGSGTGQISLQLAQAGRMVTCLDLSQGSLDFAHRCAKTLGINITTVCADATARLPFSDGEFDCVWSSGLLEHFFIDERRAMLREWARICRGKVINLVPNASCLAYRIGKRLQEAGGVWPYGLEMPLASLRDDYEMAGIRFDREFTVGMKHALEFLGPQVRSLRRELAKAFEGISEQEALEWNQGYLLVSIGSKRA